MFSPHPAGFTELLYFDCVTTQCQETGHKTSLKYKKSNKIYELYSTGPFLIDGSLYCVCLAAFKGKSQVAFLLNRCSHN